MFTGLVASCGKVESFNFKNGKYLLALSVSNMDDVKTGDSIACNGTCLTVVNKNREMLTFELMPETVNRTSFSSIRKGDLINLEKALSVNSLLDGHVVQGHVDDVGIIVRFEKTGDIYEITIKYDKKYAPYIVEKGSIAIDGISLTIISVASNLFKVGIIPHTFKETNLSAKKVGDKVNLEFDIIGKYLYRFFTLGKSEGNNLLEVLKKW